MTATVSLLSSSERLAIAEAMIAAYNAQDVDAYVSHMTDDACEANYISATSRTALTLTCPTTFGGGAGAVTFRYDVQAEVQR